MTGEPQPAARSRRESELLERAQSALRSVPGDGALLLVYASTSALTRFTANHIHQNVATDNVGVTAKVIVGDRVGVASTNALETRALKQVLRQAAEVARSLGRASEQAVLASPRPLPRALPESDQARAHWQPRARALAVKGIVKRATKAKAEAAGALSEACDVFAVANTLGVALATTLSQAELNLVASKRDGTGFAYAVARYPDELALEATAERALGKCLLNQDPVDLPAGEYTTILEPDAVGELVSFLGYLGFGAKAVQEGRSFVCGKLGQAITGDQFTLWDDGWDAAGLPLPFDFEGVPKEKVTLIDRGVARSIVYDTVTARKDNVSSTGHALGPGSTSGPMPLNLFVAPGDSSLEDMVSTTERGLLVTRFHYTNVVERMRAVLTGMTRDGTFLIEDGRISRPVKNFRFTESVLEALSRIEAVSRERRLVQGPVLAPTIKVRGFRFSGTTEFQMTTRQNARPNAPRARVPSGTMRAVVLTAPRKLHFTERPVPVPTEGEVLIRVQAVGVCGSDVHYYRDGRIGNRVVTGPLVLGHEFAGEVAVVGPGVEGWEVGERVAVDPTVPCGHCEFCRQGLVHVCPSVNFSGTPPTDGGYQEFFLSRPENLHRLPKGLSVAEGAMLEPLAVAVHAVNLAQLKAGERVAILGAGSIGLTVLQVARERGERVVLVAEPLPVRRALAAKLGAEQVLNPEEAEAVATALNLTDGLGPDVVFECAGSLQTPQQAIDMCRPRGRVLWVGIPPGDTITLSIHEARRKELTLLMARRFLSTYPQAIDLAARGKVDLACLITHRFGLAETEAAFALVEKYADGVIKALIEPAR